MIVCPRCRSGELLKTNGSRDLMCSDCCKHFDLVERPSPGPTTTPVEKREEDVATDVVITTEKRSDDWIAYINGDRAKWEAGRSREEALGKLFRNWRIGGIAIDVEGDAEPQPISNPLVCGKCATFQEAALEMVKAWRTKAVSSDVSLIESCVYKICATQLAALLEGKS